MVSSHSVHRTVKHDACRTAHRRGGLNKKMGKSTYILAIYVRRKPLPPPIYYTR